MRSAYKMKKFFTATYNGIFLQDVMDNCDTSENTSPKAKSAINFLKTSNILTKNNSEHKIPNRY